ncbi:MAG TPA: hypothetical protein VIH61_05335 [Waddliaceae bacterium]
MTKEDQIELRGRSIEQALRTNGLAPFDVVEQAQEYYDFVTAGKVPKRSKKCAK